MYLSGHAPSLPPEPVLEAGLLQRANGRVGQPVGTLGPQGVVRRGTAEGRFDDLLGWGFQLIGWRHDPALPLRAEQRAFLDQVHGIIAGVTDRAGNGSIVDVGGAYRRFFDEHRVEAALLRPDFTIFGVARTRDQVPALVDDLRQQLTG
jgi:3-(3-hydroxy-phenyl)propionate hydroxylase